DMTAKGRTEMAGEWRQQRHGIDGEGRRREMVETRRWILRWIRGRGRSVVDEQIGRLTVKEGRDGWGQGRRRRRWLAAQLGE
ncbi:hypothetical protein PIB30_109660, partial [Stylosanthes scabra]|nr:hypothetical protein [Stylosanthes scabra]